MKTEKVAIGIGSNLGDSRRLIREAVEELQKKGLQDVLLSSLYETAPVDCVPGTPPFVNAAVTGAWAGTPADLLESCHAIEAKLGRPFPHSSDEARRIDLDLLLFGEEEVRTESFTVPHRQLRRRFFVLIPLAEIASDWRVPPDLKKVHSVLDDLRKESGDSGESVIPLDRTDNQ